MLTKFLTIIIFSINFLSSNLFAQSKDTFTVSGVNVIKVEKDSNLSTWLNEMHQKYPDIGLDKVTFVYAADNAVINDQNSWCNIRNTNTVVCPKDMNNSSSPNEWSLLHEMGHIHNSSNNLLIKVNNSLLTNCVVVAIMIGSTMYIYKTKIKDKEWSVLNKIAAVIGVYCLHRFAIKYLRRHVRNYIDYLDEKYADDFANQNGDYNSLRAGLKFFESISWYPSSIEDDVHPHPIYRSIAIEKAIQERFDPSFEVSY